MGDVVNLRTHRKRAERKLKTDRAASQRALHGTTKAKRQETAARKKRADRNLDLHRLDTGDGE
jgi:hypothetical protein